MYVCMYVCHVCMHVCMYIVHNCFMTAQLGTNLISNNAMNTFKC